VRAYPVLTLTWTPTSGVERADILLAELDGVGATAIEDIPDGLRVYFATTAGRDAALTAVRDLPGLTCTSTDVAGDDWAARSQAALGPITVGDVTVAPPWTVTPELRSQAPHLVVIQPSMGFGTAHHASTRLCLSWLQQIPLAGASVLDVGTGSGVLAITAVRLGATHAVGVDVDPDALANARENVALNDVTGVELRELDLSAAASTLGRRFDVILANLTGGLLCRDAGAFRALASPGARLIISGFRTHEAGQVTGAFQDAGWALEGQTEEEPWVGVLLRRNDHHEAVKQ
jgi:ribosomal protein L11 methyltransferase